MNGQEFTLIEQIFIVLLSFSGLNTVELGYYLFMISPDKCNGSCNVLHDLSTKICDPSKTKDVSFKVFNMITKTYEAKILAKHTLYDYSCKFSSTTCDLNQKWKNDKRQCECKKYCTCKKDYSWNPTTYIFENSRYLKGTVDDSVI